VPEYEGSHAVKNGQPNDTIPIQLFMQQCANATAVPVFETQLAAGKKNLYFLRPEDAGRKTPPCTDFDGRRVF
jgi:hypothetical protein